uniref:Uncharacterized protein n=1 Tax=Macaca fascicularis TaxID=9541 RepID=A0A7N9IBT8_MACFA
MCWQLDFGVCSRQPYIVGLTLCVVQFLISRVHVHNMQVCYICILVPCWCAAPINSSCKSSSSFTNL